MRAQDFHLVNWRPTSLVLHTCDGYRLGEIAVPWPNVAVGDVLEVDGEFVAIEEMVRLFPGSRIQAIAYVRPVPLEDEQGQRAA